MYSYTHRKSHLCVHVTKIKVTIHLGIVRTDQPMMVTGNLILLRDKVDAEWNSYINKSTRICLISTSLSLLNTRSFG